MAFWHREPEQSSQESVIMVGAELETQLQRLYNLDTAKLSKQEIEHAKAVASEKAINRQQS